MAEVENPFRTLTEMSPESGHLMAQLIQANYNSYASTSSTLIDSLTRQVAELECERNIVHERIHDLCNGRWMPTPAAILAALHVHPQEVRERLAEEDAR